MGLNRLGEVTFNPGASARRVALVKLHAQRYTCRDELRRERRYILHDADTVVVTTVAANNTARAIFMTNSPPAGNAGKVLIAFRLNNTESHVYLIP